MQRKYSFVSARLRHAGKLWSYAQARGMSGFPAITGTSGIATDGPGDTGRYRRVRAPSGCLDNGHHGAVVTFGSPATGAKGKRLLAGLSHGGRAPFLCGQIGFAGVVDHLEARELGPPEQLSALVEGKRHGGFGPPGAHGRGGVKPALSIGSRLADKVHIECASPVGTERRPAMKRFFGIGVFALALFTMAGCGARGYNRYGPPPPRGVMMERHNGGRVWVPGYDRWSGNRYRRVEGRWVKPPRHGQVWVPGYRTPRGRGYAWVEGYWR